MRYSVYLVQHPGSQGGERQVTSPVGGTDLDFYESGVWLTRETGRNFFPYEQIRTIREHPDGDGAEADGAASESEGEANSGPRGGNDGDGDDEDEPARDDAAEEELVE